MEYDIESIENLRKLKRAITVFLTYRNIFITGRYHPMRISRETFETLCREGFEKIIEEASVLIENQKNQSKGD